MITYPYTKSGSIKKSEIYWGVFDKNAVDKSASAAFSLGSILLSGVSNMLHLTWLTTFNTQFNDGFPFVLIPDELPNYPDYNKFSSDGMPSVNLNISDYYYVTTEQDSNGLNYKYYVKKILGLSSNVTFKLF